VAGLRLSGVLLLGGASRRFGSPKALARLGGETLAECGWRTLGEVCDERFAVGKRTDGVELPFPLLDDGIEVRAALAGVVAGLRAAANDVCVMLPVDCPLVTGAILRELAEACADAAVPQTGPLPGAYRKSALPVLEERLAAGELSLWDAPLDVRVIELDEDLLVNVNTPAELSALSSAEPQ
jgi:molybdopterin-guanine dinucleotide biosynthesis protein A